MAPESATEGRPITQPRPALVDSACTSRCGRENGSPARLIQQKECLRDMLDVSNVRRPSAQVYYLIKPDLLSAFSVVGAIEKKTYTFKEVLTFLQHYLKLLNLIDPLQPNTIVCKDLPLGKALGVEKFEFHEVRELLLKNLTDASQTINSFKSILSKNIYPTIPEPISEPESEYSYQGYETALCQSVNLSETDSQSSSEVEEYEVVSDEESNQKQSEVDSDSDVESIILELYYSDCNRTDEEFFADESDSSSDNETEVSTEDDQDAWACVSCGIKNEPFMRYCLKCWQLRKDWLPEAPKRHKKRKPRPKKFWKKSSQSLSYVSLLKMNKHENKLSDGKEVEENETLSQGSVKDDVILPIERSDSLASTVSTGCSSQDSGFCSQENSSEIISLASTSAQLISQEIPTGKTSRRKRKFSVISECENHSSALESFPVAKTRKANDSSENVLQLKRKFNKFTDTSEGQRWLLSSKVLDVIDNVSSESENEPNPSEGNCILCCARPKNASIIHGRLSHIGFCYPCAKKLFKSKQKCPICRRKIHMITKNSYV